MNHLLDAPKLNSPYKIKINNSQNEPVECLDPKAIRSLLALMDQHAVNGGAACHWGGPSAIADFLSCIHEIMFRDADWYNNYNFVNDIGHAENALYAVKALYNYGGLDFESLKGFRSIDSKLTGHGESHLFPEGVLMSNGPLGSAFPQAQGLAMSDKLSNNERVTITLISDGACMEGEAKEAMAAIPGLYKKEMINPFLLVISDNQTKLSGRIHDAFSMQPTFDSLKALGWNIIMLEDGHDIEKTYQATHNALTACKKSPTVLWMKTVKGQGIKSTEESNSGGHGFPLKKADGKIAGFIDELWDNKAPDVFKSWANELNSITPSQSTGPKKEKMQVGVSKALIELKNEGLPIISISSDLQGSTGLAPFHKEFPKASIDIGIAESNMVSVAAGFSKNDYIPIVDTFAAFGITKGNLPLIMASLSSSPMICVFSHTGFQDAADGASHQSLTYFSALASIPNVEIIAPANSDDTYRLMKHFVKKQHDDKLKSHAKSYVFFLGRETFIPSFEKADNNIENDQLLFQGKDGLIIATGALVHEAIKARQLLATQGKDYGIINHRHLNTFDPKSYEQWVNDHQGNILTLEDHQVNHGIGSCLTHKILTQTSAKIHSIKSLGVKGVFGQSAYTAIELYEKHGLDAKSIAKSTLE